MLKRLIGIIILLAFLMLKSTLLPAAHQKQNLISYATEQAAEDGSDAEKENKQLEIADEELLVQPTLVPVSLTLCTISSHLKVAAILSPYLSLPYPPPNGR